ncbi:hypothetical protein, partial [Staphylococcus aureus]|uniref:hypothetical protein n=1 Tax=Staphylococcus aureus TaxID=1280 RepID=UPI0039BE1ACA
SGKVAGATDASEGEEAPALSTAAGGAAHSEKDAGSAATLDLTATAQGAIIKVNEARKSMGLPEYGGPDGELSIAEFIQKHSTVISDAADAEDGSASDTEGAKSAKEKDS